MKTRWLLDVWLFLFPGPRLAMAAPNPGSAYLGVTVTPNTNQVTQGDRVIFTLVLTNAGSGNVLSGFGLVGVTQVIQDWNNSVPLISGKKTYLRAHLQLAPGPSTASARLRGARVVSPQFPNTALTLLNFGGENVPPGRRQPTANFLARLDCEHRPVVRPRGAVLNKLFSRQQCVYTSSP